jgi:hypothetical protein
VIFLFVYFSLDNYNINMLMSEILVFRDFHTSRLFFGFERIGAYRPYNSNASALTDLTIQRQGLTDEWMVCVDEANWLSTEEWAACVDGGRTGYSYSNDRHGEKFAPC